MTLPFWFPRSFQITVEHGWRLGVYQALREQRGVENASPYDYGKQASELDIPQAALIARLTKAPTKYSPDLRPDRAKMRRGAVIDVILTRGNHDRTSWSSCASRRSVIRMQM